MLAGYFCNLIKYGSFGEIKDNGKNGEEFGKMENRRYSPHNSWGRSYGPSLL